MADELQALLDRIADDELKKADVKRGEIISQAQAEADRIIAAAKAEAAEIVASSRKESALLVQKGEEALRQASRDVLLSLRSELETRVVKAVEGLMSANMTGAQLGDVICRLMQGFLSSGGACDDITVLLKPEDVSAVEAAVKAALAEDLRRNCRFAPANAIGGGFKLVFGESGIVYDFTDKSLAETIAGGLSGKLASIITA